MEKTQRNSQIIAGEMQPRNFFIGRESCQKLGEMVSAFNAEGINLHAIPLINEVELGIVAEDLHPGTVIGCRPPMSEHDPAGVIVWDGFGLASVSLMTYHKKQRDGWVFDSQNKTATEAYVPTIEKKKKKNKKTTSKHEKQRIKKARNGRRV
ncbi:MAG: hypothetical protein OEX81_04350 [Candidatus Pacebacteria bacterium]|nr:hypothetical protein [Candidatus Paceibacterota bacterium]